MSAQQILLIIGIVLIVVAVALVGVAIWVYRALDIKAVRDDLSGVARAREVDSSRSGGGRRSAVRAFSDATWDGAVRKNAAPASVVAPAAGSVAAPAAGPDHQAAPSQTMPAQGWAVSQTSAPLGGYPSPPGADQRADAPTTLLDSGDEDAATTLLGEDADDGTILLDTGPVESQPSGSFEFRVVRSEMGAGSPRRIEE